MKLTFLSLALLLLSTPSVAAICLGSCEETSHGKVCTFELKVNLFASELGYFTVTGCEGIMPTLGIEKGVTYIFDQGDESNYYHPLGLAYYPDGAHDDVDELEPVVSTKNVILSTCLGAAAWMLCLFSPVGHIFILTAYYLFITSFRSFLLNLAAAAKQMKCVLRPCI